MRAIGVILAGGNNEGRLGALTDLRASAALPVGSCYRAIDFAMSNMANSGIQKIAVLTQYNSRSLQDHLGSAHLSLNQLLIILFYHYFIKEMNWQQKKELLVLPM